MEEDEQRLRVRLVGSDGRRRYDPASVDRLVAACLEPGVSVSRLALEHGVNVNLLRKWIQSLTGSVLRQCFPENTQEMAAEDAYDIGSRIGTGRSRKRKPVERRASQSWV